MGKYLKKYFAYKGNTFLYTDDNWKKFLCLERKTPGHDYILESDQDIVFKIKIKYEFGDKASKVIFKELIDINQKYYELTTNSLPKKTGYGHEFEILSISVLYDMPVDEVISKYIIQGTADGGIDAIVYSKESAEVYQIKTGFINDNAVQLMKNTIVEYNNNNLSGRSDCSSIRDFLKHMDYPISTIPSIEFKTISTNGKLEGNVDYSFIYKEYLKNLVIKKGNKNVFAT